MIDPVDVAQQYTTDSLVDRIDGALAEAGLDAEQLDWRDLAPFDNFHSRGVAATTELAQALAPEPGTHVLDIGCGVGGPARLLAATYDCRVTGIDLTPAAVAAATALSARTGLSDRTRFREADALNLPFSDATFDHAWTQHAAMNIADRAGLYAEIYRVLKPGGRLAIHDVVEGANGPLAFPVPWAPTPQSNFMLTSDAMRSALIEAGFEILSWEDKDGGHARRSAHAAGRGRGFDSPAATDVRVGGAGVPAHGRDLPAQPARGPGRRRAGDRRAALTAPPACLTRRTGMADDARGLPGVDAATLAPMVRDLLGEPAAVAEGWSCRALGGGASEGIGLYRVSGLARVGGATRPWALVCKVCAPANGTDPGAWDYRPREPLAYGSGLLAALPGGLPPRAA